MKGETEADDTNESHSTKYGVLFLLFFSFLADAWPWHPNRNGRGSVDDHFFFTFLLALAKNVYFYRTHPHCIFTTTPNLWAVGSTQIPRAGFWTHRCPSSPLRPLFLQPVHMSMSSSELMQLTPKQQASFPPPLFVGLAHG